MWNQTLSAETMLRTYLSRLGEQVGDAVAVLLPDGRAWTFGDLDSAADSLREGLPRGGRVGVRLRNEPMSLAAIHAVWRLGGSVVTISPMVPEAEAEPRLREAGACVLLDPSDSGHPVRDLPGGHTAPPEEAVVMFTSGTTGRPKAASIGFESLAASLQGIAAGSGLPAEGRLPSADALRPQPTFVPLAHMGGFLSSLSSWYLGKPLLLCERFSAELVFDLVARFRLGVLRLTPAMVWDLAKAGGKRALPGVKSVTVGTAALPEATRIAFEERYGIPVLRNYGQTEFAGAIAFERYEDVRAGLRPPGSVGRPAPGVEVRIRKDGKPPGPGEVGEIQARSRSVMAGYLDAGGRPVREDVDGFTATGDLGVLDENGILTVVGRVRDVIICGGFNVYPAMVEAALNALPGVADSAVAGLADERLGEIPVALVVPAGDRDLRLDEVRDALRGALAPYELPRALRVASVLPRFDSGKIDRPAVAAAFTQGAEV